MLCPFLRGKSPFQASFRSKMSEVKSDLGFAELQFVGDKEVGVHSPEEISSIKQLLEDYGKTVSCLSSGPIHTNSTLLFPEKASQNLVGSYYIRIVLY